MLGRLADGTSVNLWLEGSAILPKKAQYYIRMWKRVWKRFRDQGVRFFGGSSNCGFLEKSYGAGGRT